MCAAAIRYALRIMLPSWQLTLTGAFAGSLFAVPSRTLDFLLRLVLLNQT